MYTISFPIHSGLLFHQVASVDGALSEILETTCGTSIITVGGTTYYELSGIGDLESRSLGVFEMFSDSCVTSNTPSTAECYTYVLSTQLLLLRRRRLCLVICLVCS